MGEFKLLSMLIACVITMRTQETPPSFSIGLSTKDAVVKQGEPIQIKVEMTNLSDHNLDCTKVPSDGLDRSFEYDVRDGNENKIAKVVKSYPEIGTTFSVWPCILRPGEKSMAAGGLISGLYDMDPVGTYILRVSRADPDRKAVRVFSNKLTITVER